MSMNQIPRPEHPEPIWERSSWENLNGTWEFAFDHGRSARDRGLYRSEEKLPLEILVPFCPESRLSGIEYNDFIDAVCYRRHFEISKERLDGRIFLHFGAVDYKAYVYINGELYEEPYVSSFSDFEGTFTVPEDCYFFCGDNRGGSWDARYWDNPYINKENVKGKARFIFFPFNSIGAVK